MRQYHKVRVEAVQVKILQVRKWLKSLSFTAYKMGSWSERKQFETPHVLRTFKISPAESLEENVIALSPVFDSPQQPHRSVSPQIVIERHRVQVFHCDPPEYRPSFLNIRSAPSHQLPHKIRERLLVFLGHLRMQAKPRCEGKFPETSRLTEIAI